MVLIDIMLPHYGRLDLVQQTVRSVLAQDDPNWILTILDDAADDRFAEWCVGLREPRVRYLRNEHQLGINRNFQKCVSLVEHELAEILGSDDVLLPNYVQTVRRAAIDHPAVAIIQPGVEVIDDNGDLTHTLADLSKRWIYAPRVRAPTVLAGQELAVSLLRGNWLYFPALCWRSGPLRATGFREGMSVVQDLALVLELVEAGESLLVDPTVAFQYRRHRSSASSVRALDGRRFAEERDFFTDTAARMAGRNWMRASRAARNHMSSRLNALTLLPIALRQRRPDAIRALTRHALRPARRV